jgi:hypothetical protein
VQAESGTSEYWECAYVRPSSDTRSQASRVIPQVDEDGV